VNTKLTIVLLIRWTNWSVNISREDCGRVLPMYVSMVIFEVVGWFVFGVMVTGSIFS
jgi:hypothetical protein